MQTFADHNISIPSSAGDECRTTCPQCSPKRHKSYERCLAVNKSKGCWHCHHCGWGGSLKGEPVKATRAYFKPEHTHIDMPETMMKWFLSRGIYPDTIVMNHVCAGVFDSKGATAVKFPYFKGKEVVNAKYRTMDKRFRMEKGAELCLYRLDSLSADEALVICEGEMDALSCYQAGATNVTSVPNGAPGPDTKDFTKSMSYLLSAEKIIDGCKKVVLAVDNDQPGKVLEAELARRIGPEKCYRVQYPDGCKDANDVLVQHGALKLREIIATATPYPVEGIYSFADVEDLILNYYDLGESRGLSTGWPLMDKLYSIKPGQLTVLTGIPGSGKSVWLDNLLVNLIVRYKWVVSIFSPENWPLERHCQSFIEKLCSHPFDRDGFDSRRASRELVVDAIGSLNNKIFFIMPEERMMTLDEILSKAKATIYRNGAQGLVIDPWNELEHDYTNMTETQYISECLGRLRRFARHNGIHVWVVAHPQKLTKDKDTGKYKPPTMYEISGGAHWRNKADIGICIHRPDMTKDETIVYVQKVRFREVGGIGSVSFQYHRDTGKYRDVMVSDYGAHCDTST